MKKDDQRKLLFFDTETTGFADYRRAPDAPGQPRLVQLAALLTDATGKELAQLNVVIRPYAFEIPEAAAKVHGITTERAREIGVPLLHALIMWSDLARLADVHVCHNAEFDTFLVRGECLGMKVDYPERSTVCTMREMTPVLRIPGKYGDYKWPNLMEAYSYCFHKGFDGAHDALADVRACKEVFFWLEDEP